MSIIILKAECELCKENIFDNVRAKAVQTSGPRDTRIKSVKNFPAERILNIEGNTPYPLTPMYCI